MELRPGIYRHYKGKFYELIGIGRHSETLLEFVVYRALYTSPDFGPNQIWVRPIEMFIDVIEWEGKRQPRFSWVKAA
jgi:hypothetical protein